MKLITKLLVTTFLLFTMVYALPTISHAAIPHLINYQGKLTNAQGQPITGAINITFKIYDVESGGAPLWSETYSNLTIDKGIFNVMLGGQTTLNLAFDKQYWLGIQVGSDTEMTPRQRLASSAYAFRANVADEALQAQNANTVDNVGVSTTPAANKLLPLDANAKLPASTLGLKVYDSGWFPVERNSTYPITHNLGTDKCIIMLYGKRTDTGATALLMCGYEVAPAGDHYGYSICSIGVNSFKIRTSEGNIFYTKDENGNDISASTNVQYRIIILALE